MAWDPRLYDLITEWAAHGESEIRVGAGIPYPPDLPSVKRIRRDCESCIHNAILGEIASPAHGVECMVFQLVA